MSKQSEYVEALKRLTDWEEFLKANSALPSPRANLELIYAVIEVYDATKMSRYLDWDESKAPGDSPEGFLTVCAVAGLGKAIAEGSSDASILRRFASDSRWRVREAVVFALQRIGDSDSDMLIRIAEQWITGNLTEQRAVVAGLAEPRLLKNERIATRLLDFLDTATKSIMTAAKDTVTEVLVKGLSYGWSVAICGSPSEGKKRFEKWASIEHKLIRKIVRENLMKKRLETLDAQWTKRMKASIG